MTSSLIVAFLVLVFLWPRRILVPRRPTWSVVALHEHVVDAPGVDVRNVEISINTSYKTWNFEFDYLTDADYMY